MDHLKIQYMTAIYDRVQILEISKDQGFYTALAQQTFKFRRNKSEEECLKNIHKNFIRSSIEIVDYVNNELGTLFVVEGKFKLTKNIAEEIIEHEKFNISKFERIPIITKEINRLKQELFEAELFVEGRYMKFED